MNKKLSFEDIKNSPVVIIAIMAVLIIAVMAVIGFIIKDIWGMKAQIETVRVAYEENLRQQEYLEDLRDKSNAMGIEQEMIERAIPETMDIYLLKEQMYDLCDKYTLEVVTFDDPVISTSFTTETTMELTVKGTEENIMAFCRYFTDSEQIYRIEALSITSVVDEQTSTRLKQAELVLVKLSKSGSAPEAATTAQ